MLEIRYKLRNVINFHIHVFFCIKAVSIGSLWWLIDSCWGGIPIQEAHFEGAISSKSSVSEWSLSVRESILSADQPNT